MEEVLLKTIYTRVKDISAALKVILTDTSRSSHQCLHNVTYMRVTRTFAARTSNDFRITTTTSALYILFSKKMQYLFCHHTPGHF